MKKGFGQWQHPWQKYILFLKRLFYNFVIQYLKMTLRRKKIASANSGNPSACAQAPVSGTQGQAQVSWPLDMVTLPGKALRLSDLVEPHKGRFMHFKDRWACITSESEVQWPSSKLTQTRETLCLL